MKYNTILGHHLHFIEGRLYKERIKAVARTYPCPYRSHVIQSGRRCGKSWTMGIMYGMSNSGVERYNYSLGVL